MTKSLTLSPFVAARATAGFAYGPETVRPVWQSPAAAAIAREIGIGPVRRNDAEIILGRSYR